MEQLIPILERAIAADSMNPGACHFYIHAVEKVKPALAVPCAERLAALMPAAGHLVHMPAHIYARVGRYNDAVDANMHAVHADETFIADRRGQQSFYTIAYYPHNFHFLAFAAAFAGRSQDAIKAATSASENTPVEVALLALEAEYVVPARFLYLATYQRWDEILALPVPPDTLHAARGMALYARGSALAAKGRGAEAAATLDTVASLAKAEPAGIRKMLLEISSAMLAGNIAQRAGTAQRDRGVPARSDCGGQPALHGTGILASSDAPRARGRAPEGTRPKEAEMVYRAALRSTPRAARRSMGWPRAWRQAADRQKRRHWNPVSPLRGARPTCRSRYRKEHRH